MTEVSSTEWEVPVPVRNALARVGIQVRRVAVRPDTPTDLIDLTMPIYGLHEPGTPMYVLCSTMDRLAVLGTVEMPELTGRELSALRRFNLRGDQGAMVVTTPRLRRLGDGFDPEVTEKALAYRVDAALWHTVSAGLSKVVGPAPVTLVRLQVGEVSLPVSVQFEAHANPAAGSTEPSAIDWDALANFGDFTVTFGGSGLMSLRAMESALAAEVWGLDEIPPPTKQNASCRNQGCTARAHEYWDSKLLGVGIIRHALGLCGTCAVEVQQSKAPEAEMMPARWGEKVGGRRR